jgi:hypothetical protein
MTPIKIDWQAFIKAGYEKPSEVMGAMRDLQKNKPDDRPRCDDLFIRAEMRQGVKHYVLSCRCGNSRMMVHELLIRCQICGRAYNKDYFNEMAQKLKSKVRFESAQILKNPQPFIQANQLKLQRYGNIQQNRSKDPRRYRVRQNAGAV